ERQRQRGIHLFVSLRAQDLAQRDDLAGLVRDLEADRRLAGYDLHHPDTDRRQRARQVLGKIADLADLHARGRGQLEARHDRTGLDGHHLDLDAEVLELEFHKPRHRLERFLGVARRLLWRRIQQGQRRQLARRRGRIEEWYLALL